ncbi:MAG TPA: hypothetical protein VGL93_29610 [Streptosporangiaceae bacterium]|jgi:hypothetical protein
MTPDVRKPIPLTAGEVEELHALRSEGTPQHDALIALAGTDADRSDAATLRALLSLGRQVLNEKVQAYGYAALAAAQDDEDRAFRRAARARSAEIMGNA